jgi:hypothetical protein
LRRPAPSLKDLPHFDRSSTLCVASNRLESGLKAHRGLAALLLVALQWSVLPVLLALQEAHQVLLAPGVLVEEQVPLEALQPLLHCSGGVQGMRFAEVLGPGR